MSTRCSRPVVKHDAFLSLPRQPSLDCKIFYSPHFHWQISDFIDCNNRHSNCKVLSFFFFFYIRFRYLYTSLLDFKILRIVRCPYTSNVKKKKILVFFFFRCILHFPLFFVSSLRAFGRVHCWNTIFRTLAGPLVTSYTY